MKNLFAFIALILCIHCSPEENNESTSLECYKCLYDQWLPPSCDSIYSNEVCILGKHNASLQDILEIKNNCNGTITTSEEIRFLEEFLAEQENQGAICTEF